MNIKTTHAKKYLAEMEISGYSTAYCSADDYHIDYDGVYDWKPKHMLIKVDGLK